MTIHDAKATIDVPRFREVWEVLCDRWGRQCDDRESAFYYKWLLQRGMDYEGFVAAAETLWATKQFFPRPVDFLLVAAGREWGRVITLLGTAGETERIESYNALSQRAKDALNLLGGSEGLNRLAVPRAREAFLESFASVVTAEALVDPGALTSLNRSQRPAVAAAGYSGKGRKATEVLATLPFPIGEHPARSPGTPKPSENPETQPE